MANQVVDGKFTWVIKNFTSYHGGYVISDPFVIGGYRWKLLAYPRRRNLVLCFYSVESKSLPSKWQRDTHVSITIVNQIPGKLSLLPETQRFNKKELSLCFKCVVSLNELEAKNSGFLINGELKIVAEVNVHQGIGTLDVVDESEEVNQPWKKKKMNDDGVLSSNLPKETLTDWVDVNGFRVLPSQAESVRRIFEKHPNIAVEFRAKNQHLRTACMFSLLGLIETLCKSLEEISEDDLVEADNALVHLKHSGFKVDGLEKNLEEIKEKKICQMVIQNYEEELKDVKQKCSDKEALLKKENEELNDLKLKYSLLEAELEKKKAASIATPLTLDDVL